MDPEEVNLMPAHASEDSDFRRARSTAIVAAVAVTLLASLALSWSCSDEKIDKGWLAFASSLLVAPLLLLLLRLLLEQARRFTRRGGNDVSAMDSASYLPSPRWLFGAGVLGVGGSLVLFSSNRVAGFLIFLPFLPFGFLIVPSLIGLLVIGPPIQWTLPRFAAIVRLAAVVRGLVIITVFFLAQLPGVCLHEYELNTEAKSARTWCEALVPRLEAWRAEHGVYPRSLDELEPGFTTRVLSYSASAIEYDVRNDGQYRFHVPDPNDGFACWELDAGCREWKFSD
jgi:hypothetical protein